MKVDHRPEVKNRNQRIMKLAKETDEVFAVIHTPATFIRKQLAKMGNKLARAGKYKSETRTTVT